MFQLELAASGPAFAMTALLVPPGKKAAHRAGAVPLAAPIFRMGADKKKLKWWPLVFQTGSRVQLQGSIIAWQTASIIRGSL